MVYLCNRLPPRPYVQKSVALSWYKLVMTYLLYGRGYHVILCCYHDLRSAAAASYKIAGAASVIMLCLVRINLYRYNTVNSQYLSDHLAPSYSMTCDCKWIFLGYVLPDKKKQTGKKLKYNKTIIKDYRKYNI